MSVERWKCDRNGGIRGNYLRAPKVWWCDRCATEQRWRGHACTTCRRRVCEMCFHHDYGTCFSCYSDFAVKGTDTGREKCADASCGCSGFHVTVSHGVLLKRTRPIPR